MGGTEAGGLDYSEGNRPGVEEAPLVAGRSHDAN
jgi:hypothetical protein